MYIVASPDPNPRGGGQLPNPNECNSTLTSGTNNIYPCPYIDINDRGHRLRITHTRSRPKDGSNHSLAMFTIGIKVKVLEATTCMIDFFCKNTAASIFCYDRKFTLTLSHQ